MRRRMRRKAWALVHAQSRMLDDWAESDGGGKARLWADLHRKGDALRDELDGRTPRELVARVCAGHRQDDGRETT